ncbi:MAG: TetR/AcrR family transcriptional regulator [Rhodospirillales bacterium]|nr:TetR/AcrR family transcriptional regulator [Rhodospirillales bacterium]MDH3970434.1 TetR/AcrR family transcriptional regulator [Rhodospirillales bacterium]
MLLDTMSSDNPETRKRILKSALTLLEASRGKGVRMTDIAKRAGITRQALYLHFSTRAELLIATTFYLDEVKGAEERLVPSRTARSGIERLDAYIEAWGAYIPEIHGIAKALLAMRDTDDAAAKAWDERMQDMRQGCEAAIDALNRDNMLSPDHSPNQATDILWTMLSVRNWEQLTLECAWPQERYIETLKSLARRIFVADGP